MTNEELVEAATRGLEMSLTSPTWMALDLAQKAGRYARASGQLCEVWDTRCPEALAVTEIRDAFQRGWILEDRRDRSTEDDGAYPDATKGRANMREKGR